MLYWLGNAKIAVLNTVAAQDGVHEPLHITFERMEAYYYDGAGSALATWGAAPDLGRQLY